MKQPVYWKVRGFFSWLICFISTVLIPSSTVNTTNSRILSQNSSGTPHFYCIYHPLFEKKLSFLNNPCKLTTQSNFQKSTCKKKGFKLCTMIRTSLWVLKLIHPTHKRMSNYMGVSKNNGKTPPNHPLQNRVFTVIFTIHFGVKSPLFLDTSIYDSILDPHVPSNYPTTNLGNVIFSNHPTHKKAVSKNRGTPKWMVYNKKTYLKMDDLGVPLFLETAKKRIQLAATLMTFGPSARRVAASNRWEKMVGLSTVHWLNILRCSMGLVYLPTFTHKKLPKCR